MPTADQLLQSSKKSTGGGLMCVLSGCVCACVQSSALQELEMTTALGGQELSFGDGTVTTASGNSANIEIPDVQTCAVSPLYGHTVSCARKLKFGDARTFFWANQD